MYIIKTTIENIPEFIQYVKQNNLFNISDKNVINQIRKFPFIISQKVIS